MHFDIFAVLCFIGSNNLIIQIQAVAHNSLLFHWRAAILDQAMWARLGSQVSTLLLISVADYSHDTSVTLLLTGRAWLAYPKCHRYGRNRPHETAAARTRKQWWKLGPACALGTNSICFLHISVATTYLTRLMKPEMCLKQVVWK